jgi:rod shape-determining protein MreD
MSFGPARESALLVYVTAIIALMLSVLPLPQLLSIVWPQLLVLVIIYWSTMTPRAGGILVAFLAGLCLDVFHGTQLGQHSLALSLVAYLAIRLHLLTRAKPIFEQAVFVLIAMLVYELLLWAIDGWSGGKGTSDWTRWIPTVTSALTWPLIVGLLGRLHSPR